MNADHRGNPTQAVEASADTICPSVEVLLAEALAFVEKHAVSPLTVTISRVEASPCARLHLTEEDMVRLVGERIPDRLSFNGRMVHVFVRLGAVELVALFPVNVGMPPDGTVAGFGAWHSATVAP